MFKTLSLRMKLFILVAVPILALMITGLQVMIRDAKSYSAFKAQEKNLVFFSTNLDTIEVLQLERGQSARYVNGGLSAAQLAATRKKTDEQIETFLSYLPQTAFRIEIKDRAANAFGTLSALRGRVDRNELSYDVTLSAYTKFVSSLVVLSNEAALLRTEGDIGKRLLGLNVLVDASEALALTRGYASAIFDARTTLDEATAWHTASLFVTATAQLTSPALVFDEDNSKEVAAILGSNEMGVSERGILSILATYKSGDYAIDGTTFWDASMALSARINNVIRTDLAEVALLNNEATESQQNSFIIVIVQFLLAILLVVALSFPFIRLISRPLTSISLVLAEIASGKGDLSRDIPVETRDEIGALSGAFNSFMESLSRMLSEVKRAVLTLESTGHRLAGNMQQTAAAETEVSTTLASMDRQIERQYNETGSAVTVLESFLTQLANMNDAVNAQASAVAESSASIEEMIASIRSEKQNVENMSTVVAQMVSAAGETNNHIADVSERIKEVDAQSEKLLEANELIASIAGQTNLLAMNAAIEAAHAGDAGRGFAVVADEIRKLAENSGMQSKNIAENIHTIRSVIEAMVSTTANAVKSFEGMNERIRVVTDLQNSLLGSITEQSAGTSQILEALSEMNENTQQVRSMSNNMNSDSTAISSSLEGISHISNEVRLGMKEIVGGISEINALIQQVEELSQTNRDQVDTVSSMVSRFTLRE